jgi:hypothetical protein
MEPSGRNWWQPLASGRARKRLKQADRQPVATHGNRLGAHGKEGVNGSSPLEGFREAPAQQLLLLSGEEKLRSGGFHETSTAPNVTAADGCASVGDRAEVAEQGRPFEPRASGGF